MTTREPESIQTLAVRLEGLEDRIGDLIDHHRAQRAVWDNILRATEQTAEILEQERADRRAREQRQHELEMARQARTASAASEVWNTLKGPISQLATALVAAVAAYLALTYGGQAGGGSCGPSGGSCGSPGGTEGG